MRIGIDWGGTKMEVAVLDDNAAVCYRHRQPTPREYWACIDCVVNLVELAEKSVGHTCTVGIGIPGIISPQSGLVKNANSTWINGFPLDRDLEKALQRPVRVENDANCLALSEYTDGAGKTHSVISAIILGTGAGSGIVVNGSIVSGRNAFGGEWGHNPLPWMRAGEYPGPHCYCGMRGCLETFVSGSGFELYYQQCSNTQVSAEEIIRRYRKGEQTAKNCFTTYKDRLARGLSSIANILDPDIFVFGGGMSNVKELYHDLGKLMEKYCFTDSYDIEIAPAQYGDSSGVRGAAMLWKRE